MRNQHKPELASQAQARAEQAVPRQARPSGGIRIPPCAVVPDPEEQTLRLCVLTSRANTPIAKVPSILVDRSYWQTVSSVMGPIRARRRKLRMVAVGAFLCGLASLPLAKELTRRMAEPATAPMPASSAVKHAQPSLPMQTTTAPQAAAPQAEPPQRAQLSSQDALRHVRDAQELMEAGHMHDARNRLTEVLRDRAGYPPALAAMATLELENAQAKAALRWARLAVRAQPSSVENWDLLGRALTVAGLHADSQRAHAHATELYLQRGRARDSSLTKLTQRAE